MIQYIHIAEYPELHEELFIKGCSDIDEALDIAIQNAEDSKYPQTEINVYEEVIH